MNEENLMVGAEDRIFNWFAGLDKRIAPARVRKTGLSAMFADDDLVVQPNDATDAAVAQPNDAEAANVAPPEEDAARAVKSPEDAGVLKANNASAVDEVIEESPSSPAEPTEAGAAD
jgi:hypothetical protein